MNKLHLTLILIATLWSTIPGNSPLKAIFDLTTQDPTGGDILPTGDPETDPIMIVGPPPR